MLGCTVQTVLHCLISATRNSTRMQKDILIGDMPTLAAAARLQATPGVGGLPSGHCYIGRKPYAQAAHCTTVVCDVTDH
jgi:hypothetical protein